MRKLGHVTAQSVKVGQPGRPPLVEAVGLRLYRARAAAQLTQQQLADAVGCTVGYVSMVEHGTREPRMAVVLAWAVACGTTISRVLAGLEEEVGVEGPAS